MGSKLISDALKTERSAQSMLIYVLFRIDIFVEDVRMVGCDGLLKIS